MEVHLSEALPRGAHAARPSGRDAVLAAFRRLKRRPPTLRLLITLLLLAFLATAVLAYQAAIAARAQRATAEGALQDYARLVVENWGSFAQVIFYDMLKRSFRPAEARLAAGAAPAEAMAAIAFDHHCGCDADGMLFGKFWLDVRADAAAGHVESGLVTVDRLRATLLAAGGARHADRGRVGARFIALPDQDVLLIYMTQVDADDVPIRGFGVLADPRTLAMLLHGVAESRHLLTTVLMRGRGNEVLLELSATSRQQVIYRSAREYSSPYTASLVLDEPLHGLRLQAAINPAAADLLVIGGMPRERVPLLLILLALTAMLTAAAVVLLRREADLTRLRSDFVASVSHELRTPLAQIRMFAEALLLGRSRSEAERRHALEVIDRETRRLSHLVESVLAFSRSERGQQKLATRLLPLDVELGEVVASFLPLCADGRARLRCELERDVIATVDRDAVRQMLLNLLDNALKYGPAGQEITVGMALFDDAARFWVDDEGVGIPVAERAHVFDAFNRIAGEQDRGITGNGIGLTVVRELALAHGGRAWIDDAPGGGTRVVVELPNARLAERPQPRLGAVA